MLRWQASRDNCEKHVTLEAVTRHLKITYCAEERDATPESDFYAEGRQATLE